MPGWFPIPPDPPTPGAQVGSTAKQWNNRPLTEEEWKEARARFERIKGYLAECMAIVDELWPAGEDERKP